MSLLEKRNKLIQKKDISSNEKLKEEQKNFLLRQ